MFLETSLESIVLEMYKVYFIYIKKKQRVHTIRSACAETNQNTQEREASVRNRAPPIIGSRRSATRVLVLYPFILDYEHVQECDCGFGDGLLGLRLGRE